MRKWLNSTYINTIFSEKEQESVLTTNVINNDNAQYGTKGGNNTKDNLFLLSIDEVNKYFITDSQRTAVYATRVNVYVNWWLCSSGRFQSFASYINKSGDIIGNEDGGTHNNYDVRPALWVKY